MAIGDWMEFRGIQNTEDILRQKAEIVARLIDIALDGFFDFAMTVNNQTLGLKQDATDDFGIEL